MATEPRYTFDPVTQTYTRVNTPPAPIAGLGALYDAANTTGGLAMAPSPPGPNDARFSMSPFATEVAVNMQNFGQFHKTPGAIMSPTLSMLSAISEAAVPSRMGTISPVAAPVAPVETTIDPTQTANLAAMNAQVAAQQNAQAQQAQVANTAEATAAAVSGAADEASHTADGNNPGAPDSGTTSDGGGGGGAGGTAGVGNESGHTADGNNPGGGGGGGGDPDGNGTGPGGGWYKGGSVMRYADGGLASARRTENMGRGNDTMLVHMTPNEVRGLQAIAMAHGGSLTINPKTGLVEAGFLDSILPMVAGAALNVAVPGLGAAMGGFAIPALVGGASYLMNPKQGLMGGIMAGLSAYGGQNLASGLIGAGSVGAEQAAAQGGYNEMVKQGFIDQSGNLTKAGLQANNAAMQAAAQSGMDVAKQQFANQGIFDQLGQSAKGIMNQPMSETVRAFGGKTGVGAIAAPVISAFSAEEPREPGKKPQEYVRPYSFDFKPSAETDPDFKFRTGKPGESTAEQRYFTPTFTGLGVYKAGTEPGPSFYGTPTQDQLRLYSGPKPTGLAMANGGVANFDDEPGHDDDSMAMGGLTAMAAGGLKDGAFVVPADVVSHLGNGSNDAGQKLLARGLGAKPIKGKGDGMSDSIPTTIEGKQPARVADGEAYIPPEVVKKVGAKRLYSMMDKIRHARTGTKRQAPEVDPRKFIPA